MSFNDQAAGMFGAKGTGDTSGYGGLVRQAANFGSSERPYGSYFDEVADDLERAYPELAAWRTNPPYPDVSPVPFAPNMPSA